MLLDRFFFFNCMGGRGGMFCGSNSVMFFIRTEGQFWSFLTIVGVKLKLNNLIKDLATKFADEILIFVNQFQMIFETHFLRKIIRTQMALIFRFFFVAPFDVITQTFFVAKLEKHLKKIITLIILRKLLFLDKFLFLMIL